MYVFFVIAKATPGPQLLCGGLIIRKHSQNTYVTLLGVEECLTKRHVLSHVQGRVGGRHKLCHVTVGYKFHRSKFGNTKLVKKILTSSYDINL